MAPAKRSEDLLAAAVAAEAAVHAEAPEALTHAVAQAEADLKLAQQRAGTANLKKDIAELETMVGLHENLLTMGVALNDIDPRTARVQGIVSREQAAKEAILYGRVEDSMKFAGPLGLEGLDIISSPSRFSATHKFFKEDGSVLDGDRVDVVQDGLDDRVLQHLGDRSGHGYFLNFPRTAVWIIIKRWMRRQSAIERR